MSHRDHARFRVSAPFATLGITLALSACGGTPQPKAVSATDSALPGLHERAFTEEATGDANRALDAYVSLLDAAATSPRDPWALSATTAALDAMVYRSVGAFRASTSRSALAFRIPNTSNVASRLLHVAAHASDPLVRGLIFRAANEVAEARGEVGEVRDIHRHTGCVEEATIVGPVTYHPLVGLDEKDPLESADAAVPSEVTPRGPLAIAYPSVQVQGRGCTLPLGGAAATSGVRLVAFDVDVDVSKTVSVAVTTTSAAVLRAGGKKVLDRPAWLGSQPVSRYAQVNLPKGKTRFVLKVAAGHASVAEMHVWADGPVTTAAARVNTKATGQVRDAHVLDRPAPPGSRKDWQTLLAASALADGDSRVAESLAGAREPALLLLKGRALETADDLPAVERAGRARAVYEKLLEAWPSSWEGIIAHAEVAGTRRARTEARLESLRDLDTHRGKATSGAAMLDAYDAMMSGLEHLWDRAGAAHVRARDKLAGSLLLAEIERLTAPRMGQDRVTFECARAIRDQVGLSCYDAYIATGDIKRAHAELDRIRTRVGAPNLYASLSANDVLRRGDLPLLRQWLGRLLPAERTLSLAFAAGAQKNALEAMAPSAQDAPGALAPLIRAQEAWTDVEKTPEIVQRDRGAPWMPDAATALLAHRERYELSSAGLLHWSLYDVRRVSGTTDVESGADAYVPFIHSRDVIRTVRRRIFKKDGRVLEPDRTPNAAQAHADLSQLEPQDIVEAVYEGWALPDEGQMALDTPDLMPERTAVREATIDITVPSGIELTRWHHKLLGKPEESQNATGRHWQWHLRESPARRFEEGTPRTDRDVRISWTTLRWTDIARARTETIRALSDRSPEIQTWAMNLREKTAEETIRAVSEASGKAIAQASSAPLTQPADLTDARVSARTFVAEREGSRSWLIYRALSELAIPADVVYAEEEPWSSDPNYPPRPDRFMHALIVAHPAPRKDIWIDADVGGPPLPAGRVSPELRGRRVLNLAGEVSPLPNIGGEAERDEIDLRLALDATGNARGQITVLLRGRVAQQLAEAFERVVGFEREKILRSIVLGWLPYANVDDVALSSTEGSWQVALRAGLSVPGFAMVDAKSKTWLIPGVEPVHVPGPRPQATTLRAAYAGQGGRQAAMAISDSLHYHVHRRIELPPGAVVAKMPGPYDLKGSFFQGQRRIAGSDKVIEDDFVLSLPVTTIAVEGYEQFVSDTRRTDEAFLATIRIRPAP